ncbi:ABC-type multidrug transport system, permease component [Terriglobus roseus DSM 18391]|uniref:Transport permease protein n=1 Tax=Terriglobus roseus (strain DSM 18391 / NRRL B-41598 / KBS 63) TaxID=926566 RepID=I3ZCM1_TERRK|nr:ABC transporter permease [Terriglobus roseus]AFL86989.1 ABC-type multidrug transport system, permease component [Terriglobus roseus DSM 18391]
MSTAAVVVSSPMTPYVKETKYEFLRLLRARSFSISTIGFPLSFYLLFGVVAAGSGPESAERAAYLLATYSVFGLVGSSLFGLCSTISNERAQGWLELKQASPMPPAAYLLSKLMTAIAFGVIIFGVLLFFGTTMGHVHFTAEQLAKLLMTVILGVFPFASLGILLAQVVPPNAGIGFVNLIYLPMSFLSGLWFPLKGLPHWIQSIAPIWPTWHLGQLAIHDIGYPMSWSVAGHVAWLACFSAVCLVLAGVLFRRSAQKA